MADPIKPAGPEWHAGLPKARYLLTAMGYATVIFAVAGFGLWANTALIAGAIVTSGTFVARGENKIIQHLEGGVIRRIMVREGDVVNEGQTLVELDETAARAELRRLTLRRLRLVAMEARLQAEIEELPQIILPAELTSQTEDPDVRTIVSTQTLTFEARRTNYENEVATLRESINSLVQRLEGGQTQLHFARKQLDLFSEELDAKSHLLQGGLIRKPEVLALQRAHVSLQGEAGRLTGEIGDVRERISRTREQIAAARSAKIKAAVEQMHEVAGELHDVRERIRAATNVLDRITITAPVRGAVVKLRYHTPGGVIEAGKNIMEILPLQEDLIIEGRVRPQDIDLVTSGRAATVRLVALNRRVTPMIGGHVVYVSADALTNDQTGARGASDVYVVRVQLDPQDLARVPNFRPTPGMPAELYITTSERTFFEYIMRPIRDSMSRAFRES